MSETVKREKKEIVISENRDFKGVWIPERLYLTREFTPNEKFLLIEIYSLTKNKNRECFANNKHFADFVGLKENTVQKMMLKFENVGYIKRNYEYREGTKEIDRRTIKLTQKFYDNFINETENADFYAEDMENNQEGYGMESTYPIDKNPHGNGLKVGDKYNNFKSNNDLRNTNNSLSVERAVSESEQPKPETSKPKQQNRKKEANALFEQLWSLYPLKKGKGQVSDTQKLKLLDIGYEELKRAISRYVKYVDSVDYLHYKNGSTFFNSGYIDYLDTNYEDEDSNLQKLNKSAKKQINDPYAEELERLLNGE